jgi:hypothetical protein
VRFRATTDKAGRHSAAIVFLPEHAPLILEPDEALELADTIRQAGEQAKAERTAAQRKAA